MQDSNLASLEKKPAGLEMSQIQKITINWELVIFSIIVILSIATRFYDLGTRVVSHDENSHVYFSWLFSRGQGYAHDPVTHGPLQFHLIALSYFLFGDDDVTARLPAAIFSIATIAFAWNFRNLLGKIGAIITSLLLLISPYMLYYGRYTRNEAFVGLFGLMTIWSILSYLESGKAKYIYWLTAVTVLHFATKETSYIYTAQALLFLGLYFIYRITSKKWRQPKYRTGFIIALIIAILLFTTAFLFQSLNSETSAEGEITIMFPMLYIYLLLIGGMIAMISAIILVIRGVGTEKIRSERSFDLTIILGTLVLPLLSPFLMNFVGWHVPVNASEVANLSTINFIQMGIILIPVVVLSIIIGIWWNPKIWLINAGIFYGIFTILYTTIFTNGAGFFTGLVGSLGYWLAQQAVERGSQPWYYYIAVQVPVYEYLPAIGSLLTIAILAWRNLIKLRFKNNNGKPDEIGDPTDIESPDSQEKINEDTPTIPFLGFWVITSILAYTIAGEKMPWLTVHITLPMIIFTGWGIGQVLENVNWKYFFKHRGALTLILVIIFITSLGATIGSILGSKPPFQGNTLEQLSATSTFLVSFIVAVVSGLLLGYILKDWQVDQILRIFILSCFGILSILTMRTAYTAAFINYDLASELLVYAHSAPGVRIAMDQIEDISLRITGSRDMVVAYDNETSYPYWWYLRNYKNQRAYGANPTRDLRNANVILVGDDNYSKLDPIVGQAYQQFDYIRIWWPNQDYYNLTWDRIIRAITDPQMREALFYIWLNRDYTKYAQITNKDLSYKNWSPSDKMRLFIRKDVISKLWNYGVSPTAEEIIADPYEGKEIEISPELVFGSEGLETGQYRNPRNIAIAPDGTVYVADTSNHRIQHLSPEGEILHVWGRFADIAQGEAPGGTFNEPWGIAVASDGSVYVADTWNHRVQKFTHEGNFVTMWGFFGQAETPFAFWGPRDIALDVENQIYITDTGNKRIVIFDKNGEFISEFGTVGFELGEFDEPVGIEVDQDGYIYVADTWNQRIQVIAENQNGEFFPIRSWDVVAWYGQSLENKPYLAINSEGDIFVSDPQGNRLLAFNNEGEFIQYWGDLVTDTGGLNLPMGVAVDQNDHIWVADSGNNRIVRYTLPEE